MPGPTVMLARGKEIFLQAIEMDDPEHREEFLAKACGADEGLRKGIEALIRAADGAGDYLEPDRYRSLEHERISLGRALTEEHRFLDRLGTGIPGIGQYELLEEIGRGAMGVVFRARQAGLGREVVLKIVLHATLASPEERERFRLEAESAARLEHPNIVPVHEIGRHEEHDFYSMGLVHGGTLGSLMRSGRLAPREAVHLILPVVDAVQAAHDRGVIHRDLKPDNVLLSSPERVPMVADFGLAYRLDRHAELTLTGQLMGTPRYRAPELAEATDAASTRSDLYALGAILYEMLVGEPAFEGDSILTTLRKIREQAPVPPRFRVAEIDRDLDTIVLKCLKKEPDQRYRSARALAEDLEAWLETRPIAARPPGTVERVAKWVRRRPVHAGLAGTAVLLLLTLGIGGPLAAWRQNQLRKQAEEATRSAEEAPRGALRRRSRAPPGRRQPPPRLQCQPALHPTHPRVLRN